MVRLINISCGNILPKNSMPSFKFHSCANFQHFQALIIQKEEQITWLENHLIYCSHCCMKVTVKMQRSSKANHLIVWKYNTEMKILFFHHRSCIIWECGGNTVTEAPKSLYTLQNQHSTRINIYNFTSWNSQWIIIRFVWHIKKWQQ